MQLNGDWCEPWDSSEASKSARLQSLHLSEPRPDPETTDKAAAQRALEFWIGWFADPIYLTGDYPACMREQLGDRLPQFTPEQKE